MALNQLLKEEQSKTYILC